MNNYIDSLYWLNELVVNEVKESYDKFNQILM
ncbi:hypothetical protein B0I27_101486 [Arcticibacter pallidicorallinus]|uniref:Uncharacterized protein n=1 Tax=Arcticibacter pallidicorallinus TaxID=1259464 RepID=A0A2T0UC95_9SPHI|nr:hypothetical protein B0I27_101486 [Arcticibacter pallidicorallinus]